MKKTLILISIILIIASIFALVLSCVKKNIGLIFYDIFLIAWNIGNLIFALKL